MRKRLSICAGSVIFALLAGCNAATDTTPPVAATDAAVAPAGPQPVREFAQVAGTWQVVSFGGYEPARLTHPSPSAFAKFGTSGVGLRIECNWSGAPGTVADGHFVPPADDDGMNAQTQMGCGKEREDRDSRYFAFFRRNPTMDLMPDGRLLMRAGEVELVLERPEVIRLETLPDLTGISGEWRGEGFQKINGEGMRGIGLSDLASKVFIAEGRLGLTGCADAAVAVRYTDYGRLERTGGADAATIRAACGDLSGEFEIPGLSGTEIADLLAGSPKVYARGKDRLTLQSGELVIDLTREPCVMLNQSDDHSRAWEEPC
ncbi:hypothetical protein [Croceicoccus bisphenolivorans]|uniref:hypothetical protein n=1 Tax=Croceicoccus bisphenolivorans TaxID=1783232 RepID=UPI000AB3263E|nr:hypothetical protein [Croceicoccus bisphenolivorans]